MKKPCDEGRVFVQQFFRDLSVELGASQASSVAKFEDKGFVPYAVKTEPEFKPLVETDANRSSKLVGTKTSLETVGLGS